MKAGKTFICALIAALTLIPGTALAHDGRDGRWGHHHRHHHAVVLKGTVQSVNTDNGTLVVHVVRANRDNTGLVGDDVTVKAVKGWVADTNGDGDHSLADVKVGDKVLVITKRRYIDGDANTVSAAFVIDKTNSASTTAARRDGDTHFCDHDR
jgi:hypothetical protein